MAYSFREPDAVDRLKFPTPKASRQRFCIIVPARHEASVLGATLRQLSLQTHRSVHIIAVVCDDDASTYAVAQGVANDINQVTVMRYPLLPGVKPSKPKQLNYVLQQIQDKKYTVVGVIDAEDSVQPELLRHIDTAFSNPEIGIVQGGVQLMDYDSSWYSLQNVLEYYRWFNSAMAYQADNKFMPLGGNTIFIRMKLLKQAGGWPETLTEDCSLGVLLSTRFQTKMAVHYEPTLATQEETPGSLKGLFHQRVRWNQGFYHEWRKGIWHELPTLRQRLLAGYVLSGPLILAGISSFLAVAVISTIFLTAPVGLVMLMYIPLIPVGLLMCLNAVFLHDFGKAFERKIKLKHYLVMFLGFFAYQAALNAAAFWSIFRELRGETSWYKTPHTGQHRIPGSSGATERYADAIRRIGMKKLRNWLRTHKVDLVAVTILLVIAGVISGHNMAGYPQRFEDEGTYVSQAYAVEVKHQLTHYTYWYDHPPAGWIQIAGYTTITHAFERYSSAISAGREFMLVIHLICVLLLYAIARRLGIGTLASSLGVGLYALSPLTIEFSRYVLLDNVALPWLLAAFLLALSPRQKLGYAIASAVCMAIAILSKETFIVLLPVLIYTLWANGDRRNRRYALVSFAVVLTMVSSSYILYAALKNELLPGPGHVSLIGTFVWQLFGRAGSGSVFDPSSGTRGLIQFWLNIDPWLMIAGIASLPIALVNRRVRPLALGLLVGLLLLLRTGYLPYPYIIALLPFAAICLAQAFQTLIITPLRTLDAGWRNYTSTIVAAVTAITILLMASISVIPQWQTSIAAMTTQDYDLSSRQAVNWINHNVGRENRLVVESALWTDLQSKGFNKPQPVWLYKTETDPAVTKMIGGWKGIDYVVLDGPTISQNSARDFPTVYTAIAHSKLVATFGTDNQKILVYQVNHGDK